MSMQVSDGINHVLVNYVDPPGWWLTLGEGSTDVDDIILCHLNPCPPCSSVLGAPCSPLSAPLCFMDFLPDFGF